MVDLDEIRKRIAALPRGVLANAPSEAVILVRVNLPDLLDELEELRRCVGPPITCCQCGKETDNAVVVHRHTSSDCSESYVGPPLPRRLVR